MNTRQDTAEDKDSVNKVLLPKRCLLACARKRLVDDGRARDLWSVTSYTDSKKRGLCAWFVLNPYTSNCEPSSLIILNGGVSESLAVKLE